VSRRGLAGQALPTEQNVTSSERPEVVRCFSDAGFSPPLSAMSLRWPPGTAAAERPWRLPEGVSLTGPPPEQFGITIQRWASDAYAVSLRWNTTCLHWRALNAAQLLAGDLSALLSALGTDLRYLLAQPLPLVPSALARAA
jgi:hypothetical protein